MSDLPPIKVQLVAGGIEEIKSLFTSVESAAKRFDDSLNKIRASGATKRVKGTSDEQTKVTRAMEAESKKREARAEKEYREVARQAEKWAREEVKAHKKKTQQMEADAKRSAKATADYFKSAGQTTMSILGNIAGKIAGLAATFAAVGGGFTLADSLGDGVKNDGKATAMAISSRGQVSKDAILKSSRKTGHDNGYSTAESLDAMDSFTKKSGYDNMKLVNEIMPELAKTARAYDVDFKSLAMVIGQASGANPGMNKEELLKIARGAAEQGRGGLMDLDEARQQYARIVAGASGFSGDTSRNISTLGAYSQAAVAKGGATGAAEATESVSKLGEDLQKHAKVIKATYGMDVKDKYGNLKDPQEIIDKLIDATKGDEGKLLKVFGERSIRGVRGQANQYRESYQKAKESGMSEEQSRLAAAKAAHEMIEGFRRAALSDEEVTRLRNERMQATDMKLQQAFNDLKEIVAEKLLPYMKPLAEKIVELTPYVSLFLDKLIALCAWLSENPFEGVVTALIAAIGVAAVPAFGSGIPAALSAGSALLANPIGLAIAAVIATIGAGYLAGKHFEGKYEKRIAAANARLTSVLANPNATQDEKNAAIKEAQDAKSESGSFTSRLFNNSKSDANAPWYEKWIKGTMLNPGNPIGWIAAGVSAPDNAVNDSSLKQLKQEWDDGQKAALINDGQKLLENTMATQELTNALKNIASNPYQLNIPGIDGTPPAKK